MKKRLAIITILIIIVFLVATNTFAATKDENKIKQNENIVLLGDSLTDYFKTELVFDDLPIINSGVSGNITDNILKDMNNRVYRYNPTKIFILIGINDTYHKKDMMNQDEKIENIYNNTLEIFEKIKKNRPKCEIYYMSLLPVNDKEQFRERTYGDYRTEMNDDVIKINEKMKEYCKDDDLVTYIDIYPKFLNEENILRDEYTYDGLHLNNLGYAKLTEILTRYIY